jgi:hypothetical protein
MVISRELRINYEIVKEISRILESEDRNINQEMREKIMNEPVHIMLGVVNIAIQIKRLITGSEPYQDIIMYEESELLNRDLRENEILIRDRIENTRRILKVIDFLKEIIQETQ